MNIFLEKVYNSSSSLVPSKSIHRDDSLFFSLPLPFLLLLLIIIVIIISSSIPEENEIRVTRLGVILATAFGEKCSFFNDVSPARGNFGGTGFY